MPHWKLTLAYDGTAFNGWQVQPGLPTVQGTLASTIASITGEQVLPQGSGRTDTGVHALGQVASFTLLTEIPAANLLRALNRALPSSIRILLVEAVSHDFHARHSAERKTYEYRIFPRVSAHRSEPDRICPPFLAPYAWDCPWHVDISLAREAAAYVLGEHDFTSFAAVDPEVRDGKRMGPRSAVRKIFHSDWTEEDGLVVYRVTGSGFLHHMVRNLVGTFVDAASGRTDVHSIPAILARRHRSAAGQTAPARGLFLVRVQYPDLRIPVPISTPELAMQGGR